MFGNPAWSDLNATTTHTHDFMFTFFHIEIFHSRMLLGEITEIRVKVRDKFKRRCYVIIINLILRGQKMTSQLT